MTRGINQVQLVLLPLMFNSHRNGAGFDGDAALPFKLHVVQNLFLHLALFNGARKLEHAVGQRAFTMIDMCDDAKVSNVLGFDLRHEVQLQIEKAEEIKKLNVNSATGNWA